VRWAVIAPASWLSPPAAAVIEVAATAAQLTVVYGCLASRRWARLAPVAAAVLLALAIAGLAPLSGAGFNPVRGLAPDVLAVAFPALWVYFAGPLLGALAAAGLTAAGNRRPRTGKLVHDPAIPCYLRCELTHLVLCGSCGYGQ
jgi:aquaporin Z